MTDDSTWSGDASRRLAVAENAYRRWAAGRAGVVGAFVAGSTASDEACRAADVDLRVLLEGVPLPKPLFAFIDGVPLEWKFLPQSNYADAETVLYHPFRAVEVVEGVVLDDASGVLTALRERLGPLCHQPEVRRHRAGTLLALAHSAWEHVCAEHRAYGMVSVWEFRCALFWSVEAALVRTGLRPTHRRGLVVLRDALRILGADTLHSLALDAFGAEEWTSAVVDSLWGRLRELLGTLSAEEATHPYLTPERLPLWNAGIVALLEDGDVREAALPLWTLLALAWGVLPPPRRSVLAELWRVCGMERPFGVRNRIEATRRWLVGLRSVLDVEDSLSPTALDDE